MEGKTNHDRLYDAVRSSGLQYTFTHPFKNWLFFEKYILVDFICERRVNQIPLKAVEDFIVEHYPNYVKTPPQLSKYRSDMVKYWRLCCDDSLPFVLRRDTWGGICVVAKENDWERMKHCLVGFTVSIEPDLMRLLQVHRYNSLFADCILYGPLQFANHECHCMVGLHFDHPDLIKLRSDHEASEDYENPLVVGQEVRVNYNAELGFKCGCVHCVRNS